MSTPETLGKWIVGATLGEGGFSQVKLGTHMNSGETAALKILIKKDGDDVNSTERKQVESEIDAMKKIDHPNVIQMKAFDLDLVYRKQQIILVVLELASGGELFEYLSFTGAFEEPIARTYFHQLIEGVNAAHQVNICHRDLKPENLLMDGKFQLKIADFGFAHTMKDVKLYTECGTTGYMAPEMFRTTQGQGYDGKASDVWACGVVLFIMMAGFPPYQIPDKRQDWWFDKLVKKKYDRFWLAHCRSAYFSEEAKDLINKILTVDPKNRITIDDIMKHSWYTGETITPTDLTQVLGDRKKVVDQENRKLKIAAQREQESVGYGGGVCREMGVEEKIDTESDTLPPNGTESLILALKPNETADSIEIKGQMTKPSGDDSDEPEFGEAPLYDPVKVCFSKFACNADPEDAFLGLVSTLKNLGIAAVQDVSDFSLECTLTLQLSQETLSFAVNVFSQDSDDAPAIVVCQRGKGSSKTFRAVYAKIRNSMDTYAFKGEVEQKDEKEEPELEIKDVEEELESKAEDEPESKAEESESKAEEPESTDD